ncbi:PREDICTED: mycosubtilin synthase subunit C-like [Trachymyrmex cornetzi]|uniref:mycosubtilin synthase subunit C-like n=1 Tax=Trachymyrmex cornetzi TaxID=471704 RepID=UPI00084ED867|nr:PREDICTED: mycosubtilin synthase subunit C-like [Trachymyrmex cornetzi]
MSTLQQQSILQGQQTGRSQKKDLLHELFSSAAKSHPNQIAIFYEDDTEQKYEMSFKELDNITNQLARALQKYEKFETTSQSLIAICMKPSHRLLTVLLSILKAGMAYLPLDAEFPMSRVKYILEEAQPLLVLVEEGVDLSIYEGDLVVTYEQLLKEARQEQEYALQTKEDLNQLAIVLYTSGSSGVPKGVLIPHATILNRLQWQWREFPYANDEEQCIFKTSLTFGDSIAEIWGPLLQNRTLVIVPKSMTKNPEKFIPLLEKHQIQRLVLVPSLLRSLLMYLDLQNNDNVLGHLKLWICSGEILSVVLVDQFFATFNSEDKILANFYGSTEVTADVTYYLLSKRTQLQGMEKVPIGKPIDNCMIYLINKDMRVVPQGDIGELIVAGRNVAAGYIRERDTHKFLDNPYTIDPEYSRVFCTGDYAKIVKGSIIYEGRVDSQIKIKGHRVDLTEVEKAIVKIPDIDNVAVLCYKPGELSQTLVAFVTIMDGTNLSSSEIENFLHRTLQGRHFSSQSRVRSHRRHIKPYVFESLSDCHKEDAIEIIAESFHSKGDLIQWLPDLIKTDIQELMEIEWNFYVAQNVSFVMKSTQNDKMIGAAFNFDLWNQPVEQVVKSKALITVIDFLKYLGEPIIKYKLPKDKGHILYANFMGTNSDLNPAENVFAIKYMEEYCLQFAKQKEYAGIFTINTSPLTQQLSTILGYEPLQVYQVNKYETTDGNKPFSKAPDSQVAICELKMFN